MSSRKSAPQKIRMTALECWRAQLFQAHRRRILMLERIAEGRTDLVFEYVAQGNPASSKAKDGASLIQWCAYYSDVSAIRFLLTQGESLPSLGNDIGLNAAAFHGHWRLCQFLLEHGADASVREAETGA